MTNRNNIDKARSVRTCRSLRECFEIMTKEWEWEIHSLEAAVAYVKRSGVEELMKVLRNGEDVIRNSTIITSLDFYFTEPDALDKLRERSAVTKVYSGDDEFHPKVYLVKCRDDKRFAIIGSANLSEAAITGKNVEFNVVCQDPEIVRNVEMFLDELKKHAKDVNL